MKRLLLPLSLAIVAALVAGCGSPGVEVNGGKIEHNADGSTKVTGKDGSVVTGDSKSGEMNYKGADGTTAQIGSSVKPPIEEYPGAKMRDGGGLNADTAQEKITTASYTTPDDVDKVAAFFKEKYPSAKETTFDANGLKTTILEHKDGKETKRVIVSRPADGKETKIEVSYQLKK